MKKAFIGLMVIGMLVGSASGCALLKKNCDTAEFLTNSLCR